MKDHSDTQHEKLDRLLELTIRLDERTESQGENIADIKEHLKTLNGKVATNVTNIANNDKKIALLQQRWSAIVVLAPIALTGIFNYILK